MSNIIHREEIKLSPLHQKMIVSGWGEESLNNSTVERITYLSDRLKIKGYLAYPKGITNQKLPCIIWNRGGYRDRGAIDQFTAKGMFGTIASWGYVVFASQYRGSAGSEGKEEMGGKDVNDILNLIPLANELEFADSTKWGIEGWSRGGMMTLLALLKATDQKLFKCAVLIGALSDLKSYVESGSTIYETYKSIIGEPELQQKIYYRSIINFVEELPPIPYLIMHGKADETIPALQSVRLSERMRELDIPNDLILFEEGDHFLKNHRKESELMKKEWYGKYLNGSMF